MQTCTGLLNFSVSLLSQSSQIACWGSIPNPFWTVSAIPAAHSFWMLLLNNLCAICTEVPFHIDGKQKCKASSSWLFLWCVVINFPANRREVLQSIHPQAIKCQQPDTISWQVGTKFKVPKTKKWKSLRHNLCRSERYGIYDCGRLDHQKDYCFLKIIFIASCYKVRCCSFIPTWDEVQPLDSVVDKMEMEN